MARVLMSAVLDRTTEFLGDNLARIVPIIAVALVIPAALAALLNGSLAATPTDPALGIRVTNLVLSLLTVAGQLALMALALDPGRSTGTAMRIAAARTPVMIGVWLLIGILASLALVPIVVAVASSGVNLSAIAPGDPQAMQTALSAMPRSIGWFVVIYTFGLVALMVWFVARMTLIAPLVIGEGVAIRAIGRSYALTAPVAFKLLGVLLLFAIVGGVAQLAARTVFGSVLQLLLGGTGAFSAANVLTALIAAVVSAGFVALGAVFSAKLYLALRHDAAPSVALHED